MITPMIPGLKRAYAQGPAGQIHYYDSRSDGRPVLLVHQSPTSAIDFSSVIPLLVGAGFRVLALDLPGMGMSDAPAWTPTVPDYADALVAVLDHAGIEVADAVGYHTGAIVIMVAAETFPDRLGKLVLYGVSCMSDEALRDLWEQIVPHEKAQGLFTPESDGTHLSSLFQRLAPRYGLDVANRMVLSRMLAGDTLWYGHNAALTWDTRMSLMGVRRPMLFITHAGEMLDANTREAAALREDGELVVLEGQFAAGMDAAPQAWADAVAGYLNRSAPGRDPAL